MPAMSCKTSTGGVSRTSPELFMFETEPRDNGGSVFRSSTHSNGILENLNILRKSNKFCDVEIVAGDLVIKTHRSVLSASSPYFQAMFSAGLAEEVKDRIEIHNIQPSILAEIIDFIYTGEMTLSPDNVQELMTAGDMLELNEVVSGCTDYLKNQLHISNAVGIYRFAEDHSVVDLARTATIYIENNFPVIIYEEEFCELPKELLCNFLNSEMLKVDNEYQVFQAVMKWINYDLPRRKRYVFELLKYVRLPLISICLLDRSIVEISDGSLKIALKSVRKDLATRKGNLVPLVAYPRQCAKKTIFVIGGVKREVEGTWTRTIECTYDSIEKFDCYTGKWEDGVEPMKTGREHPGAATLNGKIFIAGGEHDGRVLADGEMYDHLTNSWTKIANMVVQRCEFGLCAVEGELYALGGWIGGGIGSSIERYNPVLDEWRLAGGLPEPRFSMGVVSYEGYIYIVGGCIQNQRHVQDLLRYDPQRGEFLTLAPMLEPRSQVGVAVLENYLYVVGGTNRDNDVLKSVERYSFEQNKWTFVGMLKVGRANPAVAAASGYLYVLGGDQTRDMVFLKSQVTISSVERYDPVHGKWEESTPLPVSRSEAAAIVL